MRSRRNRFKSRNRAIDKSMRLAPFVLLLTVLISNRSIGAQDTASAEDTLRGVVAYLASDRMQGRAAGSPEAEEVAYWLSEQFRLIGLQPVIGNTYDQAFSYWVGTQRILATNVVGMVGEGPVRLMVLAHYDHLRRGDIHSLEVFKDTVHNGADDNASGVAVLLRMARQLRTSQKGFGGVVFACLSGHEDGLYGSKHLATCWAKCLDEVKWVINLDMVGRLDDQQVPSALIVRVPGLSIRSILTDLLPTTDQLRPVIKPSSSPLDDQVFFEKGIQTCTFSTGLHADYHLASDDVDKLNYKGMGLVSEYIYQFLERIWGER